MDPYRFFHPHHNPRLRKVQLRHQEVSELELAAKELSRACERALIRVKDHTDDEMEELLAHSTVALNIVVELLKRLNEITPEDSEIEMKILVQERENAPGWEAWRTLVTNCLAAIDGAPLLSGVLPEKPIDRWEMHPVDKDLCGKSKIRKLA